MSRALAAAAIVWPLAASVAVATVDPAEPDPWIPVAFVVVHSTPDSEEALRLARSSSSRLGIELDLRGLIHDPEKGLTLPKEECEKDALAPYPCYVARGRHDAGVDLSVERSDGYESFRPGSFVVVAASGQPGSTELASTLEAVRAAHPDADLEVTKVYHGCMHQARLPWRVAEHRSGLRPSRRVA